MTLAELMVATSIGSIVTLGLASLTFFTARSFASMGNYVDLDYRSRQALDTMSREIRQAKRVTEATSTSLTLEDSDGGNLQYVYDPAAKTLTRLKSGSPAKTLLEECDTLSFSIYQRNPIGGTYDQYSTGSASTCKLVQLRWICSRKIFGVTKNTESVQSAKVVIRKQ
ncbi:MAG: hypothetical protein HYY23_06805 [Verrucomicrobia bacterium]|nr:hypothetical protein [Verrucomicrobiota bacterium]